MLTLQSQLYRHSLIMISVPFAAPADPNKMQKSCENMLIEYTSQSGETHLCRQTMLFLIAKAIFLRTAETLQTTKCNACGVLAVK